MVVGSNKALTVLHFVDWLCVLVCVFVLDCPQFIIIIFKVLVFFSPVGSVMYDDFF